MKAWSAYLNEAIEVESVTPDRLVDEEIGGGDTSQRDSVSLHTQAPAKSPYYLRVYGAE